MDCPIRCWPLSPRVVGKQSPCIKCGLPSNIMALITSGSGQTGGASPARPGLPGLPRRQQHQRPGRLCTDRRTRLAVSTTEHDRAACLLLLLLSDPPTCHLFDSQDRRPSRRRCDQLPCRAVARGATRNPADGPPPTGLLQEGRHFAVYLVVHTKHTQEGRSIFSRSTENGPAFQ